MGPSDGIHKDLRYYRYKTEWVKISKKKALKEKQDSIQDAKYCVRKAQAELREAKKAKLVTKIMRYTKVYPGEPGYDEASDVFEPQFYQGDWVWKEGSEGNRFIR